VTAETPVPDVLPGLAREAPAPEPAFRPHPWTAGGHRQTLLGYLCRRRLRWTLPVEDLIVDGEDGVRLLLRASWQPGPREARPATVVVHGLGGCDSATYAIATGLHAWALGWHVIRVNLRGAGDAEPLCPRLYNAGLECDLVDAFAAVGRLVPRLGVVGFSLGASLSILALARRPERIPPGLVGLVAVSPPLDLAACADRIDVPANRAYRRYFMKNLRRSYRRRQRLVPELYEAGRERGLRSIRQWDETITAPYGGYGSADEYYARSSAGPYLARLDRPTLVLAAEDDPMVPGASVSRWPLPASGLVVREMLPTGGHVGFVAPTPAPGRFWAAERAMRWLAGFRSRSS
jgi:predicted alpha/beta-fold hydrolase